MLILRPPRTSQPQQAVGVDPSWRSLVPDAIVQSNNGFSALGRPLTRVGTTTRVSTTGGMATRHLASGTNIERVRFSVRLGLASGTLPVSLVVVFRTTTTTTDRTIAALGSDSGEPGNTLFAITTGVSSASALRAIVGNSSGNASIESAAIDINDGAVHTAIVSFAGFTLSSNPVDLYLDGRRVASTVISDTGVSNEYTWIVAGGSRRTTDLAGADCDVLAVYPILRYLPESDACNLSRNPWQLFAPEPRRLWVPSAAPATPVLSAATALNITTTSVDLRVTVTI